MNTAGIYYLLVLSLLNATRTYLLISCNNSSSFLAAVWHMSVLSYLERMHETSLTEESAHFFFLFCFNFTGLILGRAACWFGVLFIENQYFPFLRMQNELLLRWALWRDWRLSLRHRSSEDFHKDIYFSFLGVNSANMDLAFFLTTVRAHITLHPEDYISKQQLETTHMFEWINLSKFPRSLDINILSVIVLRG